MLARPSLPPACLQSKHLIKTTTAPPEQALRHCSLYLAAYFHQVMVACLPDSVIMLALVILIRSVCLRRVTVEFLKQTVAVNYWANREHRAYLN